MKAVNDAFRFLLELGVLASLVTDRCRRLGDVGHDELVEQARRSVLRSPRL
jgi:hypothetical protein